MGEEHRFGVCLRLPVCSAATESPVSLSAPEPGGAAGLHGSVRAALTRASARVGSARLSERRTVPRSRPGSRLVQHRGVPALQHGALEILWAAPGSVMGCCRGTVAALET